MKKKVLILGAGYAGVNAAITLLQHRKKSDDIEISIIDKNNYHTLLTELHEIAGNRIDENCAKIPLHEIFKGSDIVILKDTVNNIDFEGKKVISPTREYAYDYIIIALGSEPNYYGIPGLKENSFPLWSYQNAIDLKYHIIDCFEKASIEHDEKKRKRLLNFTVAGGGFSGIEMIGELAHWTKILCKQYNISKSEVKLVLVEAMPRILSTLDEKNAIKASKHLTKRLKVDVLVNSKIVNVTQNTVEIHDGTSIETNTLVWAAGIKASCITENIDLAIGKLCRINIDKYCKTKYEGVYASGDISVYDDANCPHIPIVECALETSKTSALNILADIRSTKRHELKIKVSGIMVSVGAFYAVAEIMKKRLLAPLALILKHFVLWHYLFNIGGAGLVVKQFKNEVYYKRHNLTPFDNHIGTTHQSFWLVPLRMFLGFIWLKEGIAKIQDGWLTDSYLIAKVSDAVSGASVYVDGKAMFPIVSDHTPFFYRWFAETFVEPFALFFQIVIVASEIGVGLALLAGSFTMIAAIASLGLIINFIMSTGITQETWWMIPASIAVMGGGGRSFSLDYYLIPWLMDLWKKFYLKGKIPFFR